MLWEDYFRPKGGGPGMTGQGDAQSHLTQLRSHGEGDLGPGLQPWAGMCAPTMPSGRSDPLPPHSRHPRWQLRNPRKRWQLSPPAPSGFLGEKRPALPSFPRAVFREAPPVPPRGQVIKGGRHSIASGGQQPRSEGMSHRQLAPGQGSPTHGMCVSFVNLGRASG